MKEFYEGSIAFDSKEYEEHGPYGDKDHDKAVAKMMIDVAKVMGVLTNNGYACVFRYEDVGIYILEYGYEANNKYGAPGYMWVTAEEFENVLDERFDEEEKDVDTKLHPTNSTVRFRNFTSPQEFLEICSDNAMNCSIPKELEDTADKIESGFVCPVTRTFDEEDLYNQRFDFYCSLGYPIRKIKQDTPDGEVEYVCIDKM